MIRLGTVAFDLLTLTRHVYAAARLRPMVPAGADPGTVVYGGPGDGFAMLLAVALPWLGMQIVCVGG